MPDPDKDAPSFSFAFTRSGVVVKHRQNVTPRAIEISFSRMNGWERRAIHFKAGDTVKFHFECRLESGSLSVDLLAPDGSTLIHWGDTPTATSDFTAAAEGKYVVRATADHAAGAYRLEMGSA